MQSAVCISLQKHFFEEANLSFNLFMMLFFFINFQKYIWECFVNKFSIYNLTVYFCETERYLPDMYTEAGNKTNF